MIRLFKVICVVTTLLAANSAFTQVLYKNGRLPIYNIDPSEYEAQNPQNHRALKGSDGKVYIANSSGILIHEGSFIRRIGGSEAKFLNLIEFNSTIYAGGENELGYIKIDETGNYQFISFKNSLPDSLKAFGKINKIINLGAYVVFIGGQHLFYFQSFELKKVIPIEDYYTSFGYEKEEYLVSRSGKLFRITQTDVEKINIDHSLEGFKIFFEYNHKLFAFYGELIYSFDISENSLTNEIVRPLPSILNGSNSTFIREINNYLFVATDKSGLIILDKDFNLVKSINSRNHGLNSNYVRDVYLDECGLLWLSLDNGLAVLDLYSHTSFYGKQEGISEAIGDMSIVNGELFGMSSQGILKYSRKSDIGFTPLGISDGEVWNSASIYLNDENYLMVSTNNTIELLKNGKFVNVGSGLPYDICQSKHDPNRIWVGDDSGFQTFYWNGRNFKPEYQNKSGFVVLSIVSDDKKNIWLSTRIGGVMRIDEDSLDSMKIANPIFYDSTNGLPNSNFFYPYFENNTLYIASTKGIYEFNQSSSSFYKSDDFKSSLNIQDRSIRNISSLPDNRLWVSSIIESDDNKFESGIINREGEWIYEAVKDINSGVVYSVSYDSILDEIWVGTSDGIFRVKNLNDRLFNTFQADVAEFKIDPDSVIFGGALIKDKKESILQYSKKTMRFRFGANNYYRKFDLRFQYKLDGFDDDWSEWSPENEASYTNLPGGNYKMRVKAMDYFDNISEEGSFEFTILPPWYLTPWAYFLYFIGFVGFVYGAVRVSTISLQRIIKENTKEIVAQKEEIEKKNDVLEVQKGRIEKQNLNILDSIRYAKRIQLATLPSKTKMETALEKSWVMYRPKDIVSGDFYWLDNVQVDGKDGEKVVFSAVDCTGHGVPGAFMSIIGFNGLNRVVREYRLTKPSDIMDRLNEIITTSLNQQGSQSDEIKDGMDMSLCCLDRSTMTLEYAGANNSIYIIRKEGEQLDANGEKLEAVLNSDGFDLFEIKADKQPIGAFENRKSFKNHEIKVKENDMVILFTDGYADQFGGPKGKKFFYKPFKRLLLNVAQEDMKTQFERVQFTFDEWISYPDKNGEAQEQIDDICVIGVRV